MKRLWRAFAVLAVGATIVGVTAAWAGWPVLGATSTGTTSCKTTNKTTCTTTTTSTTSAAKLTSSDATTAAAAGSSTTLDDYLVSLVADFDASGIGAGDTWVVTSANVYYLVGCLNGGLNVPASSLKGLPTTGVSGTSGGIASVVKGAKFQHYTITTNPVYVSTTITVPDDVKASLGCGTGQQATVVGITFDSVNISVESRNKSFSGYPALSPATWILPYVTLN